MSVSILSRDINEGFCEDAQLPLDAIKRELRAIFTIKFFMPFSFELNYLF